MAIVITCVNAGNYLGRGSEYVNILFDMVRRNISEEQAFRFICFTDDSAGLSEGIETRDLPGNLTGWYNKLYLFKAGLFDDGDTVIFFDLDTIVCGGLDDVIKYDGEFAILKDFYHDRYGPGVMLWRAGRISYIWNEYEKQGCPQDLELGDLTWINKFCAYHPVFSPYTGDDFRRIRPDVLQELFPRQFTSYKVHASVSIPKGARVVCFHGLPRPHEVIEGWVPNLWKIGGGRTTEWQIVCNTSNERIAKNIKYAVMLRFPSLKMEKPHEGTAIIVGGGPSLCEGIPSLIEHQKAGGLVFATNNTYNYLMEHGITPDYHVMLDARHENKDFVPAHAKCFYASQCHPQVFRRALAHHNRITVWHTAEEIVQKVIGDNTGEPLIGGGSSVGLKSIALAHVMGFRNFHLFGFDSSYENGENHAYSQPLNDSERIMDVTVNGRGFKIAPWMATQVEQFKELAASIVNEGCTLTVHGGGILPYVAQLMSAPVSVQQETAA